MTKDRPDVVHQWGTPTLIAGSFINAANNFMIRLDHPTGCWFVDIHPWLSPAHVAHWILLSIVSLCLWIGWWRASSTNAQLVHFLKPGILRQSSPAAKADPMDVALEAARAAQRAALTQEHPEILGTDLPHAVHCEDPAPRIIHQNQAVYSPRSLLRIISFRSNSLSQAVDLII